MTTAATSVTPTALGGLPVRTWTALDALPVDAVVTTRDGGVSTGRYTSLNLGLHVGDRPDDVLENRRRLAAALGAAPSDLVFCNQVHRPAVAVVTEAERGRGAFSVADAMPDTDALVTTVPGIVLVVMVADCVPLVLVDPVRRVLATVHAGWGGTVRGVTTAAVEAMRGLGTDPADVVACIGPSVDPTRYQVGDDVRDAAAERFGVRVDDVVRPDGSGKWLFDLWTANRLQLEAAGVPAPSIHLAGLPTGPGTPFYSHRFEGPTGRFALAARLSAPAPSAVTSR